MSTTERLIKHDQYLAQLCSRLRPSYEALLTNVPIYSKRHRRVAEIDIIGMRRGYCDIYEVKCSHRVTKARQQLRKIKKLLTPQRRIRHAYFFCGESGLLLKM